MLCSSQDKSSFIINWKNTSIICCHSQLTTQVFFERKFIHDLQIKYSFISFCKLDSKIFFKHVIPYLYIRKMFAKKGYVCST